MGVLLILSCYDIIEHATYGTRTIELFIQTILRGVGIQLPVIYCKFGLAVYYAHKVKLVRKSILSTGSRILNWAILDE